MSSDESDLTPESIKLDALGIVHNLLPEQSKEKYLKAYNDFDKWKTAKVQSLCLRYLLGRRSRHEVKRSNEIISYNLTQAAENLYKKAKRISPKAVLHNESDKITVKLLDMFRCGHSECGAITGFNLAGFVRNCMLNEVNKLMRSIYNATVYLDSLR